MSNEVDEMAEILERIRERKEDASLKVEERLRLASDPSAPGHELAVQQLPTFLANLREYDEAEGHALRNLLKALSDAENNAAAQ